MNILFLASTLPRFKNDNQAPFVLEQASAWRKARPHDNVYILAPHDNAAAKQEQLDGIHINRFVYWWPKKLQKLAYPAILPNIRRNPLLLIEVPAFLIAELCAALNMIKCHKIDMVYAHWILPQGLIAFFINKLLKTPYVLQNHSSDLRVFNKFSKIGKYIAQRIILRAKVLFCVNSSLRQEALDLFTEEELPKVSDKTHTLPMGVNSLIKKQSDMNIPTTYDFGAIGRLTKKKGFDLFIQALSVLKKRGVAFTTAIAGDGEERAALEKISTGLNIDFLGFVSEEKKLSFFDKTKFVIFPSISAKGDVEGLPVAILESLYYKKIIAATPETNIQLLPEWNDMKNAIFLLEDPGNIDRFADLLQNILQLKSDEIHQRISNVENAIEKYQWDNLINEYFRLSDIEAA